MRRTPFGAHRFEHVVAWRSCSARGPGADGRGRSARRRWRRGGRRSRRRCTAALRSSAVEQVAFDEPEALVAHRRRQGTRRWPVEKLSKPTTRGPGSEQAVDEVAADEAGAAGH